MKVLLTGCSGYIGRRLKQRLLEDKEIQLRLFVRNMKSISQKARDTLEVIEGDTFDKEALEKALSGIDTAYYLIHSLGSKDYKNLDKISAQNFIDTAAKCGVKRVIYLGGLGVKDKHTSQHLLSRLQTGEVLSSAPQVQTLWIRAGVIIGSGSASFEIVRNLVEKLPVMITPKWVDTKAQPIAVEDVLQYLHESLYLQTKKDLQIDIGAPAMAYKDMMLETARALGLKRYLLPVPFLSINLSSYWLHLFTPVPFSVAKALIEGLASEVVIQNDNAQKYFPQIKPCNYYEAVQKAVKEIEQNQVISRWSDRWDRVWEKEHSKEFSDAVFVDRKEVSIAGIDRAKVYSAFISLGGENGWFDFDFLWELRGIIDKMLGGVGSNRGRRSQCDLRTGDCLDFWKVIDLQENERLLLFAQMKLPGLGWLEFKIEDDKLIQSAYFYPKGVLGRAYWYMLVPLHYFVFRNLIQSIVKKAKEEEQNDKKR
ncbi:MAG: SDR family oxidoreductase [Campylobacterota bacterium]